MKNKRGRMGGIWKFQLVYLAFRFYLLLLSLVPVLRLTLSLSVVPFVCWRPTLLSLATRMNINVIVVASVSDRAYICKRIKWNFDWKCMTMALKHLRLAHRVTDNKAAHNTKAKKKRRNFYMEKMCIDRRCCRLGIPPQHKITRIRTTLHIHVGFFVNGKFLPRFSKDTMKTSRRLWKTSALPLSCNCNNDCTRHAIMESEIMIEELSCVLECRSRRSRSVCFACRSENGFFTFLLLLLSSNS